MKLRDLPAACKGQTDQKIKDLIRGTDEYQAVLTDGSGTPRLMRDMFSAGLLLARGQYDQAKDAMYQAAEQAMVADAAAKMAEGAQQYTWVPSGQFKEVLAGKNDSFVNFLSGEKLRLDNSKTTFNCWEAIIIAAILGNVLENGTGLITLYQEDADSFHDTLAKALVSGVNRGYKHGSLLQMPVCGDIVLLDGLSHVVIATGNSGPTGTQVASFWPAPQKSAKEFGKYGTLCAMQLTTIEALSTWMKATFGAEPKVAFGSPSWQPLNRK
jgi:hypothetical protein